MTSMGARLRQFIVMNRMTVRQFSERFDIPYRTLHDYLADKRMPGGDHLMSLAEGGVDVNWLLTGRVLPQITFDLSQMQEMMPVSGIVLADHELARALLREARDLVDEQLLERPELVSRLGVSGILMSMWSLFATYATAVDAHADKFEKARRDGWEIEALSKLVTEPLREHMRERLRRAADAINIDAQTDK